MIKCKKQVWFTILELSCWWIEKLYKIRKYKIILWRCFSTKLKKNRSLVTGRYLQATFSLKDCQLICCCFTLPRGTMIHSLCQKKRNLLSIPYSFAYQPLQPLKTTPKWFICKIFFVSLQLSNRRKDIANWKIN